MGDLKGLLDKEGIKINPPLNAVTESSNSEQPDCPTLDVCPGSDDFSKNESIPELPVLEGTISVIDEINSDSVEQGDDISGMDDDNFEMLDFANPAQASEKQIESITESEDLQHLQQNENRYLQNLQLKENLKQQLALQIENSIAELKVKLLSSINSEIDKIFKD